MSCQLLVSEVGQVSITVGCPGTSTLGIWTDDYSIDWLGLCVVFCLGSNNEILYFTIDCITYRPIVCLSAL